MAPPDDLPKSETVTLRDGEVVTIRPIRPDDAPRLQALHSRLSPESIYLRFLDYHRALTDEEAKHLATVDYQTRMAFVAAQIADGAECLLGVARYALLDPAKPDAAEAAIVVEDHYQGKGLGVLLTERLVAYARTRAVRVFVAEISSENDRMLHFLHRTGLPLEKKRESGVWQIRIKIGE